MTIVGGSDADSDHKRAALPSESLEEVESEPKSIRKSLDGNKVETKSPVIIMAKRHHQGSHRSRRDRHHNRNDPESSSERYNYSPPNQAEGQYYYQQPDGGYPQQQGGNRGQAPVYYVVEGAPEEVVVLDFNDKAVRRAFIGKVYSILMCQLLVTIGLIALFLFVPVVRKFTSENPGLFYGVLALNLIVFFALACCENVRRTFPSNLIFLGIFTISEGLLLGAISSTYGRNEVLLAVAITAIVAFSLTIFSFQTTLDFTMLNGILFVATIILLLFGITVIFLGQIFPVLNAVYGALGALLFSVYLVYDTQLMIGGEHKYSISPEEYVFAALNLYLDIVNIFLMILCISRFTNSD